MNKHRINKKHIASLATLIAISLALVYLPTFPASADTSTGGVTVSTTPAITSMEIYDDGSWTNASSITPSDEMFLNFTLTDPDQIANITWIRIIVYDDAKANWDDANNQTDHTEFFWNEPSAGWNITEEVGSSWSINAGSCDDPGIDYAGTTYEFTLAFTPGTNAFEETANDWRFNVTAYDDDGLEGFNTTIVNDSGSGGSWPSTEGGPCNFLGSLTINFGTTSYNFTATSAGGANVSLYLIDASAGTFLNFTVVANGVWDVEVDASDWGGAGSIDVDTNDVQFLDDDSSWTPATGEIDPMYLNTTPQTAWDGSTLSYNNTQEAGSVKDIYMQLAVPLATTGGFYTQTLTVTVQNG